MAKLDFKILKNMPSYDSYGQYYYSENLQDFLEASGVETIFRGDDLYTIITNEDTLNCIDDECDEIVPFRPIANVFVGNPLDINEGTYLQKYWEFGSNEYLRTSAPNIVNLFFEISDNQNTFDINISNYFEDMGATGELKVRVINWDYEYGDYHTTDFINTITADTIDIYDEEGNPNILSHQYDSSGLKIIKGVVFTINDSGYILYKHFETRLFLGLDGVFVEDFIDIGGPDFTYLPWPLTSPIVGGISDESEYYQSVKGIVNSNQFYEKEKFEKYLAHKAFINDELGDSLGDTDIEQLRVFDRGDIDMNSLLNINDRLGTPNNLYSHNNNYWSGEDGYNFEETSVGSLFIDESLDQDFIDSCLFEFNFGKVNISHIIDSSGNGNKGILIGDYKIVKDSKGIKAVRDSVLKIPKKDTKNGAI